MTQQQWNATEYASKAAFVPKMGDEVIELLSPQAGERILDLGCGNGTLSKRLMDMAVELVGIDSSPEQVEAARALGVDAAVMDATILPFREEFDAVFSNATLHWIDDHPALLEAVYRSLKRGGRLAMEFGGQGNVDRIVTALCEVLPRYGLSYEVTTPWNFPAPQDFRGKLERSGFKNVEVEHIPRPQVLPGSVREWLELFAKNFTSQIPRDSRELFLDEVVAEMGDASLNKEGKWVVDYVRLRCRAFK